MTTLADAGRFEELRPRLRSLAYRMLGSISDAEDAVQDSYLRWHGADGESTKESIRSMEGWLVTAVTRLCLDRLRGLKSQREAYDGPWLPEPWQDGLEGSPDWRIEKAGDLSLAFTALLERLSAEERAAFLLHDVFEVGYPDIARTLIRTEAACRQLVHRARERVRRDGPPRQAVNDEARRTLIEQYLQATQARDETALLQLFAPDAILVSDGGGKVWAARRVVRGALRVARLTLGLARKRYAPHNELVRINGEWGYLSFIDGRLVAATTIVTDGQRIQAIYRVLNPDKLGHVRQQPQEDG